MQSTTRLGFGIAALIAAAFLAFSFFGTKHESWFVRAAQENAVRCLTKSPCALLTAQGGVVQKPALPLSSGSACAKPANWRQLKNVSNGQTSIVLTCTGGATYLYHMGALPGRNAGPEQWMLCEEPSCGTAVRQISASP